MSQQENANNSGALRIAGGVMAGTSVVTGLSGLLLIPAGFVSGLNLVFSPALFVGGIIVFCAGHIMLRRKRNR